MQRWRATIILTVCLLLAGCGPSPVPPPATPDQTQDPGQSDEENIHASRPIDVRLGTDRANVVIVEVADTGDGEGALRVTSPEAGVMITVDGGEPQPLPLEVALSAGEHQVEALCPDGSMERQRPQVVPYDTTVQVVCGDE